MLDLTAIKQRGERLTGNMRKGWPEKLILCSSKVHWIAVSHDETLLATNCGAVKVAALILRFYFRRSELLMK